MASNTGSSSCLIVRAATSALLSFALLLPANAQFWGNSWGGRQQQPRQPYNPYSEPYNPYAQQPYNPYGGFGGDRQWGHGGLSSARKALLPAPEGTAQRSPENREGAAPGLLPRATGHAARGCHDQGRGDG